MKTNICYKILTFLILFSKVLHAQVVYFEGGNICGTQPWKLVFEDEFNGNNLNKDNWVTYFPYTSTGDDNCAYCRDGGPGGQIYKDSNVVVSNGLLKLIAKREDVTWLAEKRKYSSGMIFSRPVFEHGKFEIKCKIPYGMGFWPAFWIFGGIGTEIDMFEFGTQNPEHLRYGMGKWRNQKKIAGKGVSIDDIDFSKDFHKYTLIWEPFFITFNIDDKEIGRFTRFISASGMPIEYCCLEKGTYIVEPAYPEGEPNKLNIIANLAVGVDGGPFTDAPNAQTILPNQFEIDYIKVYQRDSTVVENKGCQIIIFPNPVVDEVYVYYKTMKKISVSNTLGQIVYSSAVFNNEITIETKSFKKGIYFLVIESELGLESAKFVINY